MMKRRILLVLCTATVGILLSGCAILESLFGFLPSPEHTSADVPGRMVSRIDVSLYPHDPNFDRNYYAQDTLDAVLVLLRNMQGGEEPEAEPDLHGGQSYYAITAVYSSGESQVYYLLGHQYLKQGDEPWQIITTDQVMEFNHFLREHPSEDPHSAESTPSETHPTIPTP